MIFDGGKNGTWLEMEELGKNAIWRVVDTNI